MRPTKLIALQRRDCLRQVWMAQRQQDPLGGSIDGVLVLRNNDGSKPQTTEWGGHERATWLLLSSVFLPIFVLARSHLLTLSLHLRALFLLFCPDMYIACSLIDLRVRQVLRSDTRSWLGCFGSPDHTFISKSKSNSCFPFYRRIWDDMTGTR